MKNCMEKKNNIVRSIMLGIMAAAVLLLSVCAILFYRSEKVSKAGNETKINEKQMVDTDYVALKENAGKNDELSSNDTRKAINIIEVIPHDICSVFPYMIDWGAEDGNREEGYNENTPIGYDGVQYLVMNSSNKSDTRYLLRLDSGSIQKEYFKDLSDYNVTFESTGNGGKDWVVNWWRTYDNINILGENGYFEYVGAGKGLYCINTKKVIDNHDMGSSGEAGIRFEITAMKRNGDETPKGEYKVAYPKYYWAKDNQNDTYPTNDIEQKTGYHYNLKFDAATDGEYRVNQVAADSIGVLRADSSLSYEAKLKVGAAWDAGYQYRKKGNYSVKEYKPSTVTDRTGKYLRIQNTEQTDNVSGLPQGYFRLYNAQTDSALISASTRLYEVSFEEARSGAGSYILPPVSVVQKMNDKNDTAAHKDIIFEYQGEGQGTYDVSFIYAPKNTGGADHAGQRYKETLQHVAHNGGRYALTSTEADKTKLYVQGQGDYSKVVTNIDCKGIDYDQGSEGGYSDNLIGLTTGKAKGVENGSWVFHSVTDDIENGMTKIEELEQAPALGTRIYVYSQNRKKCAYKHNGFGNNEWFKLLIYMSSPDDNASLAQKAYGEGNLTGKEIVSLFEKEIEEFDRTYHVNIIQRTPGQLSVSDVERADLIYISQRPAIADFLSTIKNAETGNEEYLWNKIIDETGRTDLKKYTGEVEFTDDFSSEVLAAIYANCLYSEEGKTPNAAIMMNMGELGKKHIRSDSGVDYSKSNIGKLIFLTEFFNEPSYFARHIKGYEEYNENYSCVDFDDHASVTVYEMLQNNYNLGKTYLKLQEHEELEDEPIEPRTEEQWSEMYFIVPYLADLGNGLYEIKNNGVSTVAGGASTQFPFGNSHAYNKVPQDGWTWWTPDPMVEHFKSAGGMHNIWKIMHNRTSRISSQPVVIVTNADGEVNKIMESQITTYYMYVDAYGALTPEDFDIIYKINWMPEEVDEPNGLSSIELTRAGGELLHQEAAPEYKTEYTYNVSGDFLKDGQIKPGVTQQEYVITAADEKGNTDMAIVRVILREAFNLN